MSNIERIREVLDALAPIPEELFDNLHKLLMVWQKEKDETYRCDDDNIHMQQGCIKICILQRGWVMVGRFFQRGSICKLKNGYTIRAWGTSEGLGELAMKGVLENTKLDKNTDVEFHVLTLVASLICDEKAWSKYIT